MVLESRKNKYVLIGSYIISVIGSALFTISFAAYLLIEKHEYIFGSLVVLSHWLPNLFVIFLGGITDKLDYKKQLLAYELLCFLLTVFMFFVFDFNYYYLIIILIIRGIFENLSKVLRNVVVKNIFSAKQQNDIIVSLQFCYYLGFSIAGLLSFLLLRAISIKYVIIFDAVTFIFSFFVLMLLKKNGVKKIGTILLKSNSIIEFYRFARTRPDFFTNVLNLWVLTIFIQGSFQYLQSFFLNVRYNLDKSFVGLVFALTYGCYIGAIIYYKKLEKVNLNKHIHLFLLIQLIAYNVIFLVDSIIINILVYILLIVLFEICFLKFYTKFIHDVSSTNVGMLSSVMIGVATVGQSLMVLFCGFFVEKYSSEVSLVGIITGAAFLLYFTINYKADIGKVIWKR